MRIYANTVIGFLCMLFTYTRESLFNVEVVAEPLQQRICQEQGASTYTYLHIYTSDPVVSAAPFHSGFNFLNEKLYCCATPLHL